MYTKTIAHNDAAQIDQLAWQAIKGWPKAAGFNPIHEGLDFGVLVRWFLWDKVGRAIRAESDPDAFQFEKKTIEHINEYSSTINNKEPSIFGLKLLLLRKKLKYKSLVLMDKIFADKPTKGCKIFEQPAIYIAAPSARIESAAAELIKMGLPVIISDRSELPGYSGSHYFQSLARKNFFDQQFAHRLHAAILKGLKNLKINLQCFDKRLLLDQIYDQLSRINRATHDLALASPAALLLHGDNHPPYQEYVAVARRSGIPTITIQHGLDCERYYLDDAYASAIAVWSKHRQARYLADSGIRASKIQITGNPAYDQILSLPEKIDSTGEGILWITRPHTSKFCYSPSRQPMEGLAILDAILDVLDKNFHARLIIKPHPQDYTAIYQDRIKKRGLADRAILSRDNLQSLFRKAKLVISEDSTGGLDAMLQGKILIHAHFAQSLPVLPFCSYGAALPGFTKEMLAESINTAEQLSSSSLEEMQAGQRLFIDDFAGPLDGQSTSRQLAFFEEVITKGIIS